MPKNNETTTKFKVDISELKKSMQEAKRAVAVANSEFKAVSSTMEDWTKSTDGISAKLKQLDSNLKNQKSILASLERQYELTVAEMGEGSKAADDLKIKINNQKSVINKTEREISDYEESLSEVAEAEKKAAKTGKTTAEVLEDISNEAKDAGDGFTTLKGAVATFAGNMLTGLVSGIKDGISSIMGLAEETREYRTELAKLDTAFTTAGHSSEAATKTYKDLYTVLGDEGQATEAAGHLAKLCDTEEDLAEWTKIATGVYGTFGDSLPIEGLTEAANETAKVGQVTGPLADALNWAGVSEDKFNESLEKCSSEQERQKLITETLNGLYSEAAEKYEETNKSVMDANKANSDYRDTMADLGAKIEPVTTTLREGFNQLLQKVLELVEGVDMSAFTDKIKEGFNILVNDVLPAVKTGFQWIIDNKDILIAGLAGIATGFVAFKVAGLITSVTTALKGMSIQTALAAAKQWLLNTALLANPIGLIVALIAGLVTAFVVLWKKSDSFRNFWLKMWNKVKEGCSAAKEFISEKIAEISKFFTDTLPKALQKAIDWFKKLPSIIWTWLTNALAKVSTWSTNMTTKVKNMAVKFLNTVVNYFKQLPSKVWTWLVNTVSKVTTWSSNMKSKAKTAASNFINKVIEYVKKLPSKIATQLSSAASKVTSWGKNLATKGKEAATKLLNAVVDKVKTIPDKIKSIGKDIVSGLWNGISDKVSWLKEKISGFVGDVKDWLKKFFKIGSPSKLMRDEIGRWLPEGIAVGVDKNAKSVLNSMKNLAVNALGATKDTLSEVGTSINTGSAKSVSGGVVNNFYQTINSPTQLNRLDIYRQSKNLLGFCGGRA